MYKQKYLKYKAKYLELKGGELTYEEQAQLQKLKSDLQQKEPECIKCSNEIKSLKNQIDALTEKNTYGTETIKYTISATPIHDGPKNEFILYSMYTDQKKIRNIVEKILYGSMTVIIKNTEPSQKIQVFNKNDYVIRKNVIPSDIIHFNDDDLESKRNEINKLIGFR